MIGHLCKVRDDWSLCKVSKDMRVIPLQKLAHAIYRDFFQRKKNIGMIKLIFIFCSKDRLREQ